MDKFSVYFDVLAVQLF